MHPVNHQKISKRGISLIELSEGKEYRAYKCSAGHWTIGIGHKIKLNEGHLHNATITEAQVYELFAQDVKESEATVNHYVKVPLLQHQFDVLVSFVFHYGASAFINSTLLKLVNRAQFVLASDWFPRWNKERIPGTKRYRVVDGLTKRGHRRRVMFLGGTDVEVAKYA